VTEGRILLFSDEAVQCFNCAETDKERLGAVAYRSRHGEPVLGAFIACAVCSAAVENSEMFVDVTVVLNSPLEGA
jgi:hypothetical protein